MMVPVACLYHWYISMMYVVPVLCVGGWGWWSSKRIARRRKGGPPSGPMPPQAPVGASPRASERTPSGVGV